MKKQNQKGFTLVEILATVAIMGILTGLAITAYSRYIDYSRSKAYEYMVKSAQTAMENYLLNHPDVTEVTLEELYQGNYLERTADPKSSGEVCRGKVSLIENLNPTSNEEEVIVEKNEYEVSLCCIDYNYTYEANGVDHHKDEHCKLDE